MKKLQSNFSSMVLVLVGVAVITSALLAWVNHKTSGPISVQAEKMLTDGIEKVMGGKVKVAHIDSITQNTDGKERLFVVYTTTDSKGKPCGAAISSTTQGFSGNLTVLVGFSTDDKILGYTILETSETPGLGAKAEQWFQRDGKGCIIGKTPTPPLDVRPAKGGKGDVDAITASTITTRAFLLAVNNAYEVYKQKR